MEAKTVNESLNERVEVLELDHSKIDNIVWGGIDFSDAPDFSDTYIESADYDGEPMTDDQLEKIDYGWMYDELMKHLY